MSMVRSIYHLVRADFLERVRQYSFLIVMGISVYAGYLLVPPVGAPYTAFVIHGCRGFYNSPWIGLVFGVLVCTLLSLIGFYLVKGSIKRDYVTRVGQIVATTPIRGPIYVMGKWLSNLAVLSLILAVLTMMAVIMQIVRGEDMNVDLLALISPIWLMGVPTLAAMAGVVVLFESISFLRSGLGNVIYFFVWFGMLMLLIGMMFIYVEDITPGNDFAGVSRAIVDIRLQMAAEGLDIHHGSTDLFVPTQGRDVVRFAWEGINWTAKIIFERIIWLGIAAMLAFAAAFPFDRFDPARKRIRRRKQKQVWYWQSIWKKIVSSVGLSMSTTSNLPMSHGSNIAVHLTALDRHRLHQRFWVIFWAELILMVKSQKWWWHLIAVGLFVAILLSPLEVSHQYLFPIAWLWPVLLWSSMGAREAQHKTHQITFSVAHPLCLQLPAIWLAGVLVSCITAGSFALRLLLAGQYDVWFAWLVGAMFIPSLALALGTWTRGTRLFEIVYVLVWYIGPIKKVAVFDYMGATREAITANIPLCYLLLTILFIALAVMGRRRQIRT